MNDQIPVEAGWDTAPDLLSGAMSLEMTAHDCNLRYWLGAVPAGTLRGRLDGHTPDLVPPAHMRAPGSLYDAICQEYAFRALAEEKATRVLAHLVANAPDIDTMEFYTTQVMDEARHSMIFRNHLVELGWPAQTLAERMAEHVADEVTTILGPLERFALDVMRDQRDFIGGVVMMTVILEGALAPAAELSERKWRVLDPAASEIDRGAGIDEIRHLTVGASIARQHLAIHPEDKGRTVRLIREGMHMWEVLPVHDMVLHREEVFQLGLEQHADVVGDYEVWPGRRLIDTTPRERQEAAERWSDEMKTLRLKYMGLDEALV
jgi:hypothetical protein